MSSALELIEARIDDIERAITAVALLVHERTRLLRAQAAILGESEPRRRVASLRPRVTREAVLEYLARNPGSRAGEIATGLGIGQQAISAHLYRGKGRLFSTRNGRWYPIPIAQASAASAPLN
jgi:hypothetical protein